MSSNQKSKRRHLNIIEGSLKSNFRQYGQMKSRAGKRQREEKDEKKEE